MQENELQRQVDMTRPMVAEIFNIVYTDKKTREEAEKLKKGIVKLNKAFEKFLGW